MEHRKLSFKTNLIFFKVSISKLLYWAIFNNFYEEKFIQYGKNLKLRQCCLNARWLPLIIFLFFFFFNDVIPSTVSKSHCDVTWWTTHWSYITQVRAVVNPFFNFAFFFFLKNLFFFFFVLFIKKNLDIKTCIRNRDLQLIFPTNFSLIFCHF